MCCGRVAYESDLLSNECPALALGANEARAYLRRRGVPCSDVDEQPWGRFVRFDDPDGNRWALQQIIVPS